MKELKNGKFKSLHDFIIRVDPKDINKLQLEGLIKSGAFDELEANRGKLFDLVPEIIAKNKKTYEDKINKQSNLFDITDDNEIIFDYNKSKSWTKKVVLSEEFKSLGFYISDHPLNEYNQIFSKLQITSYESFIKDDQKREGVVAGTIMSIQEKKSSKGTPFAIVKFSDTLGEFELFLFSENLINNREKLKESESFILTLQKDRSSQDGTQKRVNVRKILSLNEMVNKTYESVSIELINNFDIAELKEKLKERGKTKIRIIIPDQDKKIIFKLDELRKFDLNIFNDLKNKKYIKKISF